MAKFNTMEQRTDEHGFKFVKNGIMVGTNKVGCLQCKEPTEFIEICTEAHFCSEECVVEWDNYYNEMCEGMQNLENDSVK